MAMVSSASSTRIFSMMRTMSAPLQPAAAMSSATTGLGAAVPFPSTIATGPPGAPPSNRDSPVQTSVACFVSLGMSVRFLVSASDATPFPVRDALVVPDRIEADGRGGPRHRPEVGRLEQERGERQHLPHGHRLAADARRNGGRAARQRGNDERDR